MRKTLAILAITGSFSAAAFAADREIKVDDRLDASADTLIDMMHAADKGIPKDLIEKAKCVVVLPGMKKAGFIFGAEYGRGFAVCRGHESSGWSAPAAMRAEGGSFGFQIGGQETDVFMLIMNERGMNRLFATKFTLGGDASVAAGPVGRSTQAETDAAMTAEILTWSRARGLFAGISLSGATLREDEDWNHDMYGRKISNKEVITGDVAPPAIAQNFMGMLNKYSSRK